MNRRDFLKGLVAAFAAPILSQVPIPTSIQTAVTPSGNALLAGDIGSYEGVRFIFDPLCEYGNALSIHARGIEMSALINKTVEILMEDARRFLPRGTPFVVLDAGEQDYGFVQAFAWRYQQGGNKLPIGQLDRQSGLKVICEAVA